MMAKSYLEHFLESLDTLPSDLQRNFTLMRDLDEKTQDLVRKINSESENYMESAHGLNSKEKSGKFKEIRSMFGKAKELSDDKVQLSMQTYEMIDKHIRRLDSELAKLEAELKEKILFSSGAVVGSVGDEAKKKGRGCQKQQKKLTSPKNVVEEEKERLKKKQKLNPETALQVPETSLLASITGTTDVLDMPVDPNEPTYCVCHQVSYGEMIGCDNPDCPIEWFHFACVGLTTKPKGKWYCSKCTNERKKR
ncbi:inhibitor of growth protein 5 isoform X1 [Brevipalpus obovatus]|uniref:inhibitor of growth protein 5 isoform X1 n=1 Tax=Brevipalpus obovatus TaxID=246614 RepID=UPI003D9DD9B2